MDGRTDDILAISRSAQHCAVKIEFSTDFTIGYLMKCFDRWLCIHPCRKLLKKSEVDFRSCAWSACGVKLICHNQQSQNEVNTSSLTPNIRMKFGIFGSDFRQLWNQDVSLHVYKTDFFCLRTEVISGIRQIPSSTERYVSCFRLCSRAYVCLSSSI